jgi:hypothetical protein
MDFINLIQINRIRHITTPFKGLRTEFISSTSVYYCLFKIASLKEIINTFLSTSNETPSNLNYGTLIFNKN